MWKAVENTGKEGDIANQLAFKNSTGLQNALLIEILGRNCFNGRYIFMGLAELF